MLGMCDAASKCFKASSAKRSEEKNKRVYRHCKPVPQRILAWESSKEALFFLGYVLLLFLFFCGGGGGAVLPSKMNHISLRITQMSHSSQRLWLRVIRCEGHSGPKQGRTMLPYIPGLGKTAALPSALFDTMCYVLLHAEAQVALCKHGAFLQAGTDEKADILEQTEPVSSPFRAHRQQLLQMRFEAMSPTEAQRCTERALQSHAAAMSLPMAGGGSPHDSNTSRRISAA